MAEDGAIECLIALLDSNNELIQRQAAKSLANLGVHHDNKSKIADAGAIPRLVRLSGNKQISVRIEAIAALANLAVNDNNEVEIVRVGGLDPICEGCAMAANGLSGSLATRHEREIQHLEELATQCARALRNLSVNPLNKSQMAVLGVSRHLQLLANYPNERISQQARRAMRNLEYSGK